MKLFAVATHRNGFLFEWEHAAKKFGWDYELVGLGQPWTGYIQYQQWMADAMNNEDPDTLCVVIDAYDALVQRTPEEARHIYEAKATKPIVAGGETGCSLNCNGDGARKCGWPMNPNGGFLMGPAGELRKLFEYGVKNNIDDDQVAIGTFGADGHCDRMQVDGDRDFVANVQQGESIEDHGGKVMSKGKVPIVVHTPGQSFDLGARSRKMRTIILPDVKTMPALGYMTESWEYGRRTFYDRCGFNWWWIPISLAIVAVIVAIVVVGLRWRKP